MAHPTRAEQADALCIKLSRYIPTVIVWDNKNDEWDTGERCLVTLSESVADWGLVIQDDAILSDEFYENLKLALAKVPRKTIVSLYTGKTRPYPTRVKTAVAKANLENASWLEFDRLMWGVGIAININLIQGLLDSVKDSNLPYDQRIGSYFFKTKKPVYYLLPSIVDHRDEKSLANNDTNAPRVAHIFTNEAITVNDKVIKV